MKVACIGGGPAGLFTAICLRRADPSITVDVFERNAVDDTFGFGVVFSEETLENIQHADPESLGAIAARFRHWSAMDMDIAGYRERSDGHNYAALSRKDLLAILAARAGELGVNLHFQTPIEDPVSLAANYDVLVAADGVNSVTRAAFADEFRPNLASRVNKYAWFATERPFERFTFLFVDSPYGLFWAHIYPYNQTSSTFIVECAPETWRRAGLEKFAAMPLRPGENDVASMRFCQELFAEHLDGYPLIGNNSKWLEFPNLSNESWRAGNVVLAGDAAHTAHFSIGSGTKLALEDAASLARALLTEPNVDSALKAYEAERQPLAASLKRAAQTSMEWFEGYERYLKLDRQQFCMQLMTRSQRMTYDDLKQRDPAFVGRFDAWFADRARADGYQVDDATPPMFYPFKLRNLLLRNRIVVSPMAQYSAVDGMPNDWHLVHLGSRAVGGAGLVFTEMTCVSPEGRISPGCPGLWSAAQAAQWTRIVDFVHGNSEAAIGLQLGHAGRKASTKRMWEGDTDPLDEDNWPIIGPSPLPYRPDSQIPRQMEPANFEKVIADHVRSAEFGAQCGFDILELHFAHGYLASSFLSPLSNHRTDRYGGSLENRARFPLEIFDAVRAAWPAQRPISVRISATDWVPGGFDGDDAVAFAAMLRKHGCDIVDVSTGQTSIDAKPAYGRLYQTPFADRIRQEVGIPTMTVGAVASVDDANTIIASGRADLAVLARPHLVDPYWTLNAAMDLGFEGHHWPMQYLSGKRARRREQHAK